MLKTTFIEDYMFEFYMHFLRIFSRILISELFERKRRFKEKVHIALDNPQIKHRCIANTRPRGRDAMIRHGDAVNYNLRIKKAKNIFLKS